MQTSSVTKKKIHHNQGDVLPEIKGEFNTHKYMNVINHINLSKNKWQNPVNIYMTTTIDAENAFLKSQHAFMKKALDRLEGIYLTQ